MPHHYKEYYMQWQQGPKLHIHSKPNLANVEEDRRKPQKFHTSRSQVLVAVPLRRRCPQRDPWQAHRHGGDQAWGEVGRGGGGLRLLPVVHPCQ